MSPEQPHTHGHATSERPAGEQPSPVHLSATTYRAGEAEVLALAGELDMATAPEANAALERRLAQAPSVLVVDLTAVTFLGSVGLAALARAHEAAGDRVSLRVVAANRAVRRPIELTGLIEELAVYESLQHALAGSKPAGQA
jgi:anti-sigma B factor antagonist